MPKVWNRGQGARLRAYRNPTGLSQEKVAEKLGCSWMTVHRWETDKRGVSERDLNMLAKLYGVRLDQIVPTFAEPVML